MYEVPEVTVDALYFVQIQGQGDLVNASGSDLGNVNFQTIISPFQKQNWNNWQYFGEELERYQQNSGITN